MKQPLPLAPSALPAAIRTPTGSVAAKIRVAVKGTKLSATEQVTVAENLWEILDRVVDRGISKSRVLIAAGAGSEGDSTKRLERYALNPAWDVAKRDIRAGRLTKTAQIYVRIADAAGTLARQDADAYIVALFNGTRFSSDAETIEPDDLYDELARLLRTVCLGVARQHDLKSAFRKIDARHLCYYDQVLRRNPDHKWSAIWHSVENSARLAGLHDDNGNWSLPYPSVLIGWGLQEPPKGEEMAVPPTSEGNSTRQHALAIEVRLALLPLGPDGTPEPAFLTCPWTLPATGDARPPTSDRNDEVEPASHRGRHYYPGEGDDARVQSFQLWSGTAAELAYYDAYGSHYPVRVDVVSPEACRRYLSLARVANPSTGVELTKIVDDRDPSLNDMTPEQSAGHCRSLSSDFDYPPEALLWRSTPDTLAEIVENALLFDRERLDVTIDTAAARLRNDVDLALKRVDDDREKSKAELERRWTENRPLPVTSES